MLQNFDQLQKVTNGSAIAKQEHNDCFVKATSAAFDIPYDQAHEWVREKFGREDGKGTFAIPVILGAYSKHHFPQFGQLSLFENQGKNVYVKCLGKEPKQGGELCNPSYTHKQVAYTVKTFADHHPTGNYILLVRGHALAVKDGKIIDNDEFQTQGYRRVVERAYKITSKPTQPEVQ